MVEADLVQRQHGERDRADRDRRHRHPAGGDQQRRLPASELRLEARDPSRFDLRLEIGGAQADGDGGALSGSDRLRGRDRVLVGLHHLLGDVRPGKALDVARRGPGHLATALGLFGDVAQRLGQRLGITRHHQHAVDAVADHVPVAGDVGCDDRRPGGERLGQHHAEALPVQRGGDEQIGATKLLVLALVVHLAQHADIAIVEHQRRELFARRADHGQLCRDVLTQRLERTQQQRQALALDRLADEQQPERVAGMLAAGARDHVGVDVHAVRDHPVVAAEEAPPGPGGGVRDRDPDVQVVEHPARAEQVGDAVREAVLGVGVKRPDER